MKLICFFQKLPFCISLHAQYQYLHFCTELSHLGLILQSMSVHRLLAFTTAFSAHRKTISSHSVSLLIKGPSEASCFYIWKGIFFKYLSAEILQECFVTFCTVLLRSNTLTLFSPPASMSAAVSQKIMNKKKPLHKKGNRPIHIEMKFCSCIGYKDKIKTWLDW